MSDKKGDNDRAGAKVTPITDVRQESSAVGDEQGIVQLANTFEASARRWELLVYPSLFAFIVLACFGFYLIYNLTQDVSSLARNVGQLTSSIDRMVVNMDTVATNMNGISTQMEALEPMRISISSMEQSTRMMAMSTENMRQHIGALNYNIGRPMSTINSFFPW